MVAKIPKSINLYIKLEEFAISCGQNDLSRAAVA